jgi:hypothetical protein
MVSSDPGPSRWVLANLIKGALHLPEKIPPQAAVLPLIVHGNPQHLIFCRSEQARCLHLILSYASAKTSLAARAAILPSR